MASGRAQIATVAVAMTVATGAGCARIYSLRLGAGVERAPDGASHAQAMITLGFAGHAGGAHYVAPRGALGASSTGDGELALGLGVDWLLALPRLGLRVGPEYHAHRTLDGDGSLHALGGRIAALGVLSREDGDEEDGLLEAIFRPRSARLGSGCYGSCSEERAARQVTRRHSLGVEVSAHALVGGELAGGRGLGYLGVSYEYDVLRIAAPAPAR